MENIKCNCCNGTGEITLTTGQMKGHIIRCWNCDGSGEISKDDDIRGLMFESMIADSVNLRQKLLWTFKHVELEKAGHEQIKVFEEAIAKNKEEDYIIEEYKNHLKSFSEWLKIILLDAQLIYLLRSGLIVYKPEVEARIWYVK